MNDGIAGSITQKTGSLPTLLVRTVPRLSWSVLKCLSLPLFLISYASPSLASDWWFIAMDGDKPERQQVFIDRESFVYKSAKLVEFWEAVYYETVDEKYGQSSKKVKLVVNCSQRTLGSVSFMFYDKDGAIVHTIPPDDDPIEMSGVVPDSIGAEELNFVCRMPNTARRIGDGDNLRKIVPAFFERLK